MRNPKINYISKKHPVGSIAVGHRAGAKSDQMVGEVIETYFTLNWPHKNYAAKIKCFADGKIRSYQYLRQFISKEDFDLIIAAGGFKC